MKLEEIKDPYDLLKLNKKELKQLSSDIRKEIINLSISKKIHLGSNLGVVELTISLLKNFPDPKDKIFFDTGHQCYVHKMLTGRLNKINTIRDYNGLSGFPSNYESEYDFFSLGHSSNSLSIAQGFIESNNENNIITIIGDASISNGLAFEALNNIGFNKNKMLIILNDNGMSISKNVGQLSLEFNNIKYKNYFFKIIKNFKSEKWVEKINNFEKKINKKNFFHNLGFNYIGPIDGHNFYKLDKAIKKGIFYSNYFPTIVHIKTIKGKGLKNNNLENAKFHSPEIKEIKNNETFSKIVSDYLYKKIKNDKNIKILNAAMTYSLGMEKILKNFPNNFEDVGINEEHCVSKALGIHLANKKIVVSMYSTFLQRTYDQILNDVCREKKPILFIIDRADLSYGDGDTHHGIYDLGMIKSIPNNVITMPSTKNELIQLLDIGLKNNEIPFFIRITNEVPILKNNKKLIYGDWLYLKNNNNKTCIISYGNSINKIFKSFSKYDVDILNAIFLKGFDEKKIFNKIKKYKKIIFYERVYKEGALYKDVLILINKYELNIKCILISFEKNNIGFGEENKINKINKMDIDQIKKII